MGNKINGYLFKIITHDDQVKYTISTSIGMCMRVFLQHMNSDKDEIIKSIESIGNVVVDKRLVNINHFLKEFDSKTDYQTVRDHLDALSRLLKNNYKFDIHLNSEKYDCLIAIGLLEGKAVLLENLTDEHENGITTENLIDDLKDFEFSVEAGIYKANLKMIQCGGDHCRGINCAGDCGEIDFEILGRY
jgi:hypothetical protein